MARTFENRQVNSAPGGRVIASQQGDVYFWNFQGDHAASLVEEFHSEPSLVPAQLRSTMPSRLLGAAYQVVPFFGRDLERQQLREWLQDPDDLSLSVRVIFGPGGQGKSRLADRVAAEVCE